MFVEVLNINLNKFHVKTDLVKIDLLCGETGLYSQETDLNSTINPLPLLQTIPLTPRFSPQLLNTPLGFYFVYEVLEARGKECVL